MNISGNSRERHLAVISLQAACYHNKSAHQGPYQVNQQSYVMYKENIFIFFEKKLEIKSKNMFVYVILKYVSMQIINI